MGGARIAFNGIARLRPCPQVMCHKCAHFECALSGGGPVVRQVRLGNLSVRRARPALRAMRCAALRSDVCVRSRASRLFPEGFVLCADWGCFQQWCA